MKRICLIQFILLLSVSNSFSQGFHIGVKLGANINKISGQSFSEKFTFGYHAGGFAEIGLGKKWSIQPEVLFNQVNVDTSNKFSKVYTSFATNISRIQLNYLSIPVLVNYQLSNNISIQAGPQFGILKDQNTTLLQNGKNAFKDGDLSLLAGVRLQFLKFRVYGRYAIGLENLNDIDNKDQWKSQGFQLGVGFSIL